MTIELSPATDVWTYLKKEYGGDEDKVRALVTELRVQLEEWLAPGGAGNVSTVADIPTMKILSGIDYRGIVFDGPRIEPEVAIVAPGRLAGSFLITGIEPLSSLHADGVDFGERIRLRGTGLT